MSEWIEGNLRIRGLRENIIKYIRDEFCGISLDEKYKTWMDMHLPVKLEDRNDGWQLAIIKPENTREHIYLRKSDLCTIRMPYPQNELIVGFSEGDNLKKESIVSFGEVGLDPLFDFYFIDMAKKYKLDFRTFIFDYNEIGRYTFYKNGDTEDYMLRYNDFAWNYPIPEKLM